MDSTLTYKCPNCGAGLLFDADTQRFSCEFCLSEFGEDELKRFFEEEGAREDVDYSSEIDEYICPSCGAEVLADKNTASDFCYYCHNPVVLSGRMKGEFKPTKVIPFKLSREDAKAAFLAYAKKKKFIPKNYFSESQFEKISGVYYPFWVTDADTSSRLSAIGKIVRTWRQGDYRYTETSRYSIHRAGRIHFEDITSSAISTEDKAMLEGILPYPCEDYKDFSMPYLQGFLAKKRDMDKDAFYGEVKSRMNSYSRSLLLSTARGYNFVDVTDNSVSILSSHWEYSLMPVWIMTYVKKGSTKDKDKTYIYAMNGATGKVYGEFPVSIPKLLLLALGVLAGAFAIALLFGYLFFM